MKNLKGYLLIVGAAVFWGASATLAKLLLNQELDTLLLVQARVSFSFLVLALAFGVGARRLLRIRVADVWRFALLGVLGLAGANFTYYFTIKESSVATAITIQYTAPLFVMAYEVVRGEERFTAIKLLAALLALAGCVGVVTGFTFGVLHVSSLGLLTGVGSIASFAFLTIATRHLVARYSAWTVTFYSIAFASLFWFVMNAPREVLPQTTTPSLWLSLFALAMASVLIPNLLFTAGLRYVVPSRAIITSTLEPVVAIVTAAMVVGETVGAVQMLGSLLVILAIILLQWKREENDEVPVPDTVEGSNGA
jgi:drug/metabolite transporter (DMT)-like permease